MRKNNFFIGLLIGLIFPAVAFILSKFVMAQSPLMIKKPFLLLMPALLINLFIIRYLAKGKHDQTIGGLVISTFGFMAAWFFLRYIQF
jgi:hypothetical protein